MGILDKFRLDGRVAVVTGAGRGIGRGIAVGLAEAGCDVLVTARRGDEIAETARLVEATGRRGLAVTGDIRDPATSTRLADEAVTRLGGLHLWVSNAGGAQDRTMRQLEATPDSAWADQIGLNLDAVFYGARAAAARMERGASIINIASVAAGRDSNNNGPYAAAKAGVIQLTKTLSHELAGKGIRVNAVSPGPIPTEVFMEALGLQDEHLPMVAANLPLKRLGTPEDVAAAVIFLASENASWITGHNLVCSGGL